MNVMNKLTRKHVFENRRKACVTILGILISVSMLTAVSTGVTSVLKWMENRTIVDRGYWQVAYGGVSADKLNVFDEDTSIKNQFLLHEVGYAKLEGSQNEAKPYVYITALDKQAYEDMPIQLLEGRLPENENEILISEHIRSNGSVNYQIGDEVTYEVGERYVTYETTMENFNEEEYGVNRPLGQENLYFSSDGGYRESDYTSEGSFTTTGEELRLNGETKTYTIVGVMDRLDYRDERYSASGYTVYTYFERESLAPSDKVEVRVYLKNATAAIYEESQTLAKELDILPQYSNTFLYHEDMVQFNQSVLYYSGVTEDIEFNSFIAVIQGILIVIIMIGSVSLIYNAFAISISERSRQFGILSTVGATKKQKRNAVFYEAFLYGTIGIPIGILAGIIGLKIAFTVVTPLLKAFSGYDIALTMYFSRKSIVVTVLFSILTIFISCYVPAKRAANVSAIDAIRQSRDIKLTPKAIRTSRLTKKLFGFPGEIALKNMKRNKKRYRSLIFSLFLSTTLFISVTYYIQSMKEAYQLQRGISDYDAYVSVATDSLEQTNELARKLREKESVKAATGVKELSLGSLIKEDQEQYLNPVFYEYVKERLKEDAQIYEESYEELLQNYHYYITVLWLDDGTYEDYCEKIGISLAEREEAGEINGIFINNFQVNETYSVRAYNILDVKGGDELTVNYAFDTDDLTNQKQFKITVAGVTHALPAGMSYSESYENAGYFVLSETAWERLLEERKESNPEGIHSDGWDNILIQAKDPVQVIGDIKEVLKEQNFEEGSYLIVNQMIEEIRARQMLTIVGIFAYGFITLISIICLANMCNTIYTSIGIRRKEFAMLKSVGMTPKAFHQMIMFESLLYGLKALLYGIPVSLLITYGINYYINSRYSIGYQVPWRLLVSAIVMVFLVVGIAMGYSTRKVRKENIIDGLRSDIY